MYPPPQSLCMYLDARRPASQSLHVAHVVLFVFRFLSVCVNLDGAVCLAGAGRMGNGGGQDEAPVIEEEDT